MSSIYARTCLTGILILSLLSCGGKRERSGEEKPARVVSVPDFNADSAYAFVSRQVAFGPRVPNTPAHRNAGDFLVATFKRYGAAVTIQEFDGVTFDGKKVFLRNIIASFYPNLQKRILLAAHWDTRPFADRDKDQPDAKMDGANDGGSGVAVILEMARQFSLGKPPAAGVDIILFDGEDWGEKEGQSNKAAPPEGLDSWWCLGSQYWSKHKHKPNYSAYYGILLDMVGGKGSRFFREGHSMEYAPKIVDKVWGTATRLGHADRFLLQQQGGVMDDHYFVNEIAGIPMIDIIPYDPAAKNFWLHHHTTHDNMENISKETLKAVGDVVMNVIYYEE